MALNVAGDLGCSRHDVMAAISDLKASAVRKDWSGNAYKTLEELSSALMSQDHVELSFGDVSNNPEAFRGLKKGTVYLMPYQLIFVAKDSREALKSFTMPFYLMKGCEIKQPMLGANYIKGTIRAEPHGGWEGSATFKLTFTSGGAIEFGQLMFRAAQQASRGTVPPIVNYYNLMPNSVGGGAPPLYPPAPSAVFAYPPPLPVGIYPAPPPLTEGTMDYMLPPPYPGPVSSPAAAEGDGGVNRGQPNPPTTPVPMEQPPPYSQHAERQ